MAGGRSRISAALPDKNRQQHQGLTIIEWSLRCRVDVLKGLELRVIRLIGDVEVSGRFSDRESMSREVG